jgi:hypothetical protein
VTATVAEGNIILRWEPSREASFFSYQISLMHDTEPDTSLSPMPIRGAEWVDTAPQAGTYRYGVRTVSASGVVSAMIASDPVIVPAPP